MPVRASVEALSEPGHAILRVSELDAAPEGLALSIQRQQGPDFHLADDGWRRTEAWLLPARVERRRDVLEFHLGPEICDRLAGIATVRLRVKEPDIGVVATTVVAWPSMLTSGAVDPSSKSYDDTVRLRRAAPAPPPEPQPAPEPELPPQITEQDIRMFYAMLGPVQAYAVALAMHAPVALAQKVFLYTEDDLAQLVPVSQALANKYAAYLGNYLKWKEEIAFAGVFFMVTRQKIEALRLEVKKLREMREPNPATDTPLAQPGPA